MHMQSIQVKQEEWKSDKRRVDRNSCHGHDVNSKNIRWYSMTTGAHS